MSRQADVEQHLISGKTLTQDEARKLFKSWRLAPIIDRMRGKGYDVVTSLVGDTQHAMYWMSAKERARIRSLTNSKRAA
jgi:hypothetical protein